MEMKPFTSHTTRQEIEEMVAFAKTVLPLSQDGLCKHNSAYASSSPAWTGRGYVERAAIPFYIMCGSCGSAWRPDWDGKPW